MQFNYGTRNSGHTIKAEETAIVPDSQSARRKAGSHRKKAEGQDGVVNAGLENDEDDDFSVSDGELNESVFLRAYNNHR